MSSRAVIHVDMDAFFVSVELKRRPELRGRPIVVGGRGNPQSRGVVAAASYEVRRFGVRSGMALKTACRLCPDAVFLPVDFGVYEAESERFMKILRCYTPLVESFGLDEAFLEIESSNEEDVFERSVDTANEIRKRVKRELGLTASTGVAPNKLLAKLASDMKKPDGMFVIRNTEVVEVLEKLPVRKLWGVGEKTEKRLRALKVKSVGDLSKLPRQYLELNFGPSFGRMLFEHSHGIDSSPVVPFHEPNSMGREVTFDQDTDDKYFIREILYELSEDVAGRLRREGYVGRTVSIKARYGDFQTVTRSRTLEEATSSLNDIGITAGDLLEKVEFSRKVRLIGVKVSNLDEARVRRER